MRIFWSNKAFREAARKHVYDSTQKPPTEGFERMTVAFVDSNNRVYYKYADPMDMPMVRKGKYDEYIKWLSRGIDGEELELMIDSIDKAVDECINTMDKNGRIKNISKVSALTKEMRIRKELIVHEEIYFRIMSVSYVREDENPAVWDITLEAEKVEQFKQDSKGGLYDFFMEGPLAGHIAGLNLSEEELTASMNESRALILGTTKWINMLTSEAKS